MGPSGYHQRGNPPRSAEDSLVSQCVTAAPVRHITAVGGRQMNRMLDALMRIARQQLKGITANLLAVIGAAVTIASFVSLLTSRPMRSWVSRHPFYMFFALIIAIFTLLVVLNYAQDLRGRWSALAGSTPAAEPPKPTIHDSALFRELIAILPPNGTIMEWLKEDFNSLQLPSARMQTLGQAGRKLTLNTVGFDDQSASAGYHELTISIEAFCQKARKWALPDATGVNLEIPDWWRFERQEQYHTALTDINDARSRLINAYDDCLRICHSAGMDS